MRFVKQLAPETIKLLWRIHKHSKHYRVRRRALCILLSFQGLMVSQLACMFNVSQQTIYNWLNAWEARRFPGLYDNSGKGRKCKLAPDQKEQVTQWAKKFPENLNKIIASVKEKFDIVVSKSTIKRILKEFGMSWRRIRRRPEKKPDAKKYEQKKEALKTLKKQEDKGGN